MTRRLIQCMFSVILAIGPISLSAQLSEKDEDSELRAKLTVAYLYNIAKFVDWPNRPETLDMCVSATGLLADLAKSLDGREFAPGRTIKIHDGLGETSGCHIAYVDSDTRLAIVDPASVSQWKSATLTISNDDGALRRGYAIHLKVDGRRMIIRINESALNTTEIVISSKLLRLAQRVRG